MSNPTDSTPPQPDGPSSTTPPADSDPVERAQPAGAPISPDAQPTEAYPPADVQPTEAYPPADVQPTEAYPPAAQPGYPQSTQPGYGQPAGDPGAYGQPAYGAPGYGDPAFAAPVSAADRPRTLGWIALGAGIGGLVLVGAAFIPLLWVSVVLAVIGGVLLLLALVLGIVTLASKKQGGKGLGIGAIAIAILGGLAWIAAISIAVFLTVASVSSDSVSTEPFPSASSETTAPEGEETEEGTEEPAGAYDEAAYLAQVRPEVTAIMQEIDPSITEEMLSQIYSDEMLVSTGQAVLVAGDAAKEAFVSSTVETSNGVFTEDQAARFYDALLTAAQQHLVE